jgi:chromate transporter
VSQNPLVDLIVTFGLLSLVAIGGINTILPEIHQQVVVVHRWVDDDEFANLVAIAQASPGPNGLVTALIGWRVAGLTGFYAAALATAGPPTLLAFGLSRLHKRMATTRWLRTLQEGLAPIAIGLILASGLVTARAADHTPLAAAMTILVALVVWRTSFNPLWLLGAGALAGLLGA